MRILILTNFGMGLYKFRKELIESLVSQNFEVTVSFPRDEYVESITDLGCVFEHVNMERRGKNPIKDLRLMLDYLKLIKKVKPDIILTYTIKPNIYGGLISTFLKIKYYPNITGSGNAIENGGIISTLTQNMYKLSIKKATKVFFQNQYNLNFFRNEKLIEPHQPILIPGSGVNVDDYTYKEYPSHEKPVRILYIGRIMKSKGINELLESIKTIKKKNNQVQFDIVGFCDENYEDILIKYENEDLLEFHGQKKDIMPFIEKSHAIIQPSYHEGMSNVLLEAASSGRPVLASRVPGCQETFDEGVTGFGFEAGHPASLTNALEKFIKLPNDTKKVMGLNGRKKIIKEFNREIIVDAYNTELNRTLEEKINEEFI